MHPTEASHPTASRPRFSCRPWCGSRRTRRAACRRQLKATLMTYPVCPCRTATSFPVAAFQIRTVLSWLAVARRLPSGLNATPDYAVFVPDEGVEFLAGRDVPDLRGLVPARRGQPLAVVTERHPCRDVAVPGEGVKGPTGRGVPDPGGPVPARRGQALAVRAEGDGDDRSMMCAERGPNSSPVSASRTCTHAPSAIEARRRPSGLSAAIPAKRGRCGSP